MQDLNLGASRGVAVREFPLQTGEADYLLFVDRNPAGVIEAKPEGTTLSGVDQLQRDRDRGCSSGARVVDRGWKYRARPRRGL